MNDKPQDWCIRCGQLALGHNESDCQAHQTWSERITIWQRETFGVATWETALDRAGQEWDELCEKTSELADDGAYPMTPAAMAGASERLAEEAADVVIVLAAFCAALGFDLAERVETKMAINRARKWRKTTAGCGQHEEE